MLAYEAELSTLYTVSNFFHHFEGVGTVLNPASMSIRAPAGSKVGHFGAAAKGTSVFPDVPFEYELTLLITVSANCT